MVGDTLIKYYTFPLEVINSNNKNIYAERPINGEILRVYSASNGTGSLTVFESGTNYQILMAKLTSGTGTVYNAFPRFYPVDSANTTGSNAQLNDKFVMNSVPGYYVSGLVSGTATTFGPVTVYYR